MIPKARNVGIGRVVRGQREFLPARAGGPLPAVRPLGEARGAQPRVDEFVDAEVEQD